MRNALLRVSPISRAFNRGSFDSGVEDLNIFLCHKALRNKKQRISRTWVLHEEESQDIIGYYTLCSSSISVAELPHEIIRKLPHYPIPCVLLARLAVGLIWQGNGMGKKLLKDAINKTIQISQIAGVFALLVDAKDDNARSFYEHYGFLRLPTEPYTLFLPMQTLFQQYSERE